MLNLFRTFAFCLLLIVTLFSCSKTDLEQPSGITRNDKTEQFVFMGETVLIASEFPKEFFNQSEEDFSKYYASLRKSRNARTQAGKELTHQELNAIITPIIKKYPDLSWEKEISQQDLKRIFADFPGITTKEQVREKSEIISLFYETLAAREVAPAVAAYEDSRVLENLRLDQDNSSPDISKMSDPERDFLLLHPVRASFYTAAAGIAYAAYNGADGNKTNAKTHSVWNALAIRQIILGAAVGEDNAVAFVRDGTSKHELYNNGNQKNDVHAAMDLHNNMSARQWMRKETSWGWGPLRKMPTDAEIMNTMNGRANTSAQHPMNDILLWHGGISNSAELQNTWNRLYNDLTSPNEHLVHVNP